MAFVPVLEAGAEMAAEMGGAEMAGETGLTSLLAGVGVLYTVIGFGAYYGYKKYGRSDLILRGEAAIKSVKTKLPALWGRKLRLTALGEADEEEAVEVMMRAFLSASTDKSQGMTRTRWVLGDLQDVTYEERKAFFKYWQTFYFRLAYANGYAFGVRKQTMVTTGELLAVTIVCPPDSEFDKKITEETLSSMKLDVPVKPDGVLDRIQKAAKVLRMAMNSHGKMRKYFLNEIAVAPEHQGKGIGRLLVDLVSTLADHDGVQCYLDCTGAKTIKQFRHLGYETREIYNLQDEGAGSSSGHSSITDVGDNQENIKRVDVHAMVRPLGGINKPPTSDV